MWVNAESHVYHREGSRFYGTTKKGKYVSEADAIKEGDRAAARDNRSNCKLEIAAVDDSGNNGQKLLCLPGLAAGSLAAETLQERRKQGSQTLLMVCVGVHFSRWR